MSIMREVILMALTAWGNFFVSIGDFLDSHEGAITALATAFIAAFTLALWRSTTRLWKETKETSWIAKRSAAAAERTVSHMEDTAERQLRAYAMVTRAEIWNGTYLGITGQWVFITIKNFGRTPASSVTYWLNMESREVPLTSVLERDLTMELRTTGPIAPGDTFTARVAIPLLSDGFEISQGTHAFYVFGEFMYRDVFNRERVSNFRYMQRGEHWMDDAELEICQDGNDWG